MLNYHRNQHEAAVQSLAKERKALRTKLLANVLVGEEQSLVFSADFDGYGDSGSIHSNTGNEEVDRLLSKAVDLYVTFDWYNNDGGGGDITWLVMPDKIVINGYYNETIRQDALSGAEF